MNDVIKISYFYDFHFTDALLCMCSKFGQKMEEYCNNYIYRK